MLVLLCRLCLQSYHLVAIGMPEPSAQCSSVSPAVSDKQGDQQQEQHEQQQDDSQQAPLQDGSQQEQQQQVQQEELRDVQASADRKAMDSRPDRHASDTSEMLDTLASAKQMHGSIVAGALAGQVGVSRAVMTEAGAAPVGPRQAQPGMGGRIQPGRGSSSMPGAGSVPLPLPQLPLPHLLHLELDSCRCAIHAWAESSSFRTAGACVHCKAAPQPFRYKVDGQDAHEQISATCHHPPTVCSGPNTSLVACPLCCAVVTQN